MFCVIVRNDGIVGTFGEPEYFVEEGILHRLAEDIGARQQVVNVLGDSVMVGVLGRVDNGVYSVPRARQFSIPCDRRMCRFYGKV